MTRILIVEDEHRLRKDLVDFLELTGFSAEGVASAEQMRMTLALARAPDVIILDVGLPDGNGFDLAAEIRKTHACGIIMLTALGTSDDRIRGFDSGADIYLVKDSTLREIEAAIRSLLRRSGQGTGKAAGNEEWVLDSIDWLLIAPNRRSLKLTATELAFMTALCRRSGEVCRREELMATLARPRSSFDNRHLDAVVSRLRRKLEEHTQLSAPIKVAYGVGYVFSAPVALR